MTPVFLDSCPVCDKKFEIEHKPNGDGSWSHTKKWECHHTEQEYKEALDKAQEQYDLSLEMDGEDA